MSHQLSVEMSKIIIFRLDLMTFILKLDLDMVKMYLHTKTRKYCSRMLTVRRSGHGSVRGVLSKGVLSKGVLSKGVLSRGVCGVWEVWCPGGCGVKGDCGVREVVVSREVCAPVHVGIHPPVKRMTDACENITLPAT